jgi:Pyruvate/2-oxoacid:ferredoxin oxidoreductase gamma subunit/GNAT superfamily N-acetyltransferase
MKIRKAKPDDCKAINTLMGRLIDEIYAHESEKVRNMLKTNFTRDALKELCAEEQAHLYVVVMDRKIVAFLLGWLFQNVFTVYWMYCRKEYRGKGIAKELLESIEDELKQEGCYKIEMYTYAEHNLFLDFCTKLGFKKGTLIKKGMFGFKIRNIYKYIGDCSDEDKIKKIKIIGEAGQGVKLMSYTLASILSQLGNEVSLNLEYDSAVRSGVISADLIYSEKKIENPIIDEADMLIKFTKTRDWFPARNLVIDESLCGTKNLACSIYSQKGVEYGFENVAISKFGSKIFINMIALGRILRFIGVNIMLINIEKLLPPKSVEKNLSAIKYGFNFRDDA